MTATHTFNSIYELAEKIQTSTPADGHDRDHPFAKAPSAMTTDEALTTAQEGGRWAEGAKQIKPVELDLSDVVAHDMEIPRIEPTVQGFRANVPAYLAGSPVSMFKQEPTPMPNRLIKIGVQVAKQYDISQAHTFNRGNAILSVLGALSAAGFSIELWALWSAKDMGNICHVSTLIKDSTAHYSPDSIAFALCNDAFQRRLMWRVAHQSEHEEARDAVAGEFGTDRNFPVNDFDLSFPYMEPHRHWANKDSALKHIVESTTDQLATNARAAA